MNLQETALILIDLQKDSHFNLIEIETVIDKSKKVIKACRELDIPIIYTRQINRNDHIALSLGEPIRDDGLPYFYNEKEGNHEIFEEIAPQKNDVVIDKYRWSAFHATSLDLVLRSLGAKHLIIGGVVTDGCIMTTVFDAYFNDYHVHLIKDMCTTSNEGAHMAALMIMANWIYNLEVYHTSQLINRIKGKDYNHWKCQEADSLPFTPENMREVYQNLVPMREP